MEMAAAGVRRGIGVNMLLCRESRDPFHFVQILRSHAAYPSGLGAHTSIARLVRRDVQGYTVAMGNRAHKVLEEALALPVKERADLAVQLLASMDGEPDQDVEAAWAEEIERRARRALSGKSHGIDSKTVHARIEERLRRK